MIKHNQHDIYHADDVFSICNFDSSMIRQGISKAVNMISFSTLLLSKTLKEASFTKTNSYIILTWQQVYRKEAKEFLVLVYRRIMR